MPLFQTRWQVVLALVAIPSCSAVIYSQFSQLTSTEYDFVIVGGGTAGNVVANRLTENSGYSVLVLEAGGSHEGVLDTAVPFFCASITPNTPYDWNYTTTAQSGLNGRTVPYPRGHILGGSSSVNYMAYTRGTAEDYDRFGKLTNDWGWSWNALFPYFLKNEKWVKPADEHNTAGQFVPWWHNLLGTGFTSVSMFGYPQPIDDKVYKAATASNSQFEFNQDMNSGYPLGSGWIQYTIDDNGQRSSSATSYLSPTHLKRLGLNVLTSAQVTRLLQTGTSQGKPTFKKVEFKSGGALRIVTARKEVILSAGSIGTPHILLNSGIGDSAELSALGVTPLVNLPSVGKNLTDHPTTGNSWSVNSNQSLDNLFRDPALIGQYVQQWNINGTGPMVSTVLGNQLIWGRLPDNSPLLKQRGDSTAGPRSPHYELIPINGLVGEAIPSTGNFITMVTAVVNPVSRGSVRLASNDPLQAPLIDPGFFKDDYDVAVMREAIKAARRYVAGSAWKGYILEQYGVQVGANADAEIDQHVRNHSISIFHPVGTAAMSPYSDMSYGVVDPDLRVKKISGLRVVDASIFPRIPSAHTQAAVYAVAERASDIIKWSY